MTDPVYQQMEEFKIVYESCITEVFQGNVHIRENKSAKHYLITNRYN